MPSEAEVCRAVPVFGFSSPPRRLQSNETNEITSLQDSKSFSSLGMCSNEKDEIKSIEVFIVSQSMVDKRVDLVRYPVGYVRWHMNV